MLSPGCTAVHHDVLPGRLLLLVYVLPPSLAQDFFVGLRLVSKASLITIKDEMWVVLQTVICVQCLIDFEEAFNDLCCSTRLWLCPGNLPS